MKITDMIKAISQETNIKLNKISIVKNCKYNFNNFSIFLKDLQYLSGNRKDKQTIKIIFNDINHIDIDIIILEISNLFYTKDLNYFFIEDDINYIKYSFKDIENWLNCVNKIYLLDLFIYIEKAYNHAVLLKSLPIKTETTTKSKTIKI